MRLYSAEGAGLQQDKVVVRIQPLRCLTNDLIERTEVIRALQRKCFEHVRTATRLVLLAAADVTLASPGPGKHNKAVPVSSHHDLR